jgi:acetolactate synthase-1/2/3 large subunit
MNSMIGAESLVRTLIASGVDTCFANPGTSEMHFVAALDRAPGMRSILGLFEGVVTGGADAYARMTGKPAATLMHCGPGLANGLSLLHNAMRARVPIVNIVGDQATYHALLDPPLATDTAGLARPASAWVRKVPRTEMLGAEAAAAIQAARASSGIATLILPSDVSWNEGGEVGKPLAVPARPKVSADAVGEAARLLRSREETLILISGEALSEQGLALAHRIAAATGARLSAQTFNTRVARGRGRYPLQRIPYVVDDAVRENAGVKNLILVGTGEPVTFFAYPNKPGIATPKDAKVHVLARPLDDVLDALARLADELGAPKPTLPQRPSPEMRRGRITSEGAAETLAAVLPEQSIVIEEAITLRNFFFAALMNAAPHDSLENIGGAIGAGPPLATGAAVAAPGRRVVAVQADGSAMYTIQALWTQAREKLDVTTIILNNRKYAVLFKELADVGATPGQTANDLFELNRPDIDWLRMAESMGVEAARADSLEQFADLLRHSFGRRGPFLIDLALESA